MVRNWVLQALERCKGEWISGGEIAKDIQVSRTAVNKAVLTLREQGYDIQAVQGRGYRLASTSDRLSEQAVRAHLRTRWMGKDIYVMQSVDSTNTAAKRLASSGAPNGLVVIAEQQIHGRGRKGRQFYSPEGSGIYMSVLLRPNCHHQRCARVTAAVALAVTQAIETVCHIHAGIKWVNDLFVDGKKVCGVLSEGSVEVESGNLETMVIGIGINVYPPKEGFPCALQDVAGSLWTKETPENFSRARLIAEILYQLETLVPQSMQSSQFLQEYRKRCFILGQWVQVVQSELSYRAKAIDIGSDGALLVEIADGARRRLQTGEVSIRKVVTV